MTDYAENGVEHVPTMDAERRELLRTVRRAVDTLPAKTREAVYLYYFEEKSLKEIGAFLGKSPNAVSGLLKYGRRKLKDTLWEEAEELIKELRPRKEAVANVCAAIPLGKAAWCTKAGTAAAGAGKALTTGSFSPCLQYFSIGIPAAKVTNIFSSGIGFRLSSSTTSFTTWGRTLMKTTSPRLTASRLLEVV